MNLPSENFQNSLYSSSTEDNPFVSNNTNAPSSDYLSVENNPFVATSSDKLDTLAERKAKKLAFFDKSKKSQFENISDTYTTLNNGFIESNRNKIWNELSGAEYASLLDAAKEMALGVNDQNQHYNLQTGEIYEGPVKRFYGYGTKNSDELFKAGTSRGDQNSSDVRYTNPEYNHGPEGVDVNKKQFDYLLPQYLADTIEYLGHGRKEAIENRVVPDITDIENYDRFGSGATEYYKTKENFLGDPNSPAYGKPFDKEQARNLLYEYAATVPVSKFHDNVFSDDNYLNAYYEKLAAEVQEQRYKDKTFLDDVLQTVPSMAANAAKGVLDLLDALQEAGTYIPQSIAKGVTGNDKLDIDLFEDGFKQSLIEGIDDFVGYNRKSDEITLQKALEHIKKANIDITSLDSIKKGLTSADSLGELGEAFLTVLADPSATMGMFAEIIGAGAGLKVAVKGGGALLGKLAKPEAQAAVRNLFSSNLDKIQKATVEAKKAGDVAKLTELSTAYTFNKKAADLIKGSVYTNADMMVRMNNDITAFKENNNGEGPAPDKLFQIALLNRIVSSAEVISLKNLAGIKNTPKVVKEAVNQGVIYSAGKAVGVLTKTGKGGLGEGIQETTDSIVEQLNQKVGSADYVDKSVQDILKEASDEILLGTIAGTASGVQLAGASGAVTQGLQSTMKGLTALGNMEMPSMFSNSGNTTKEPVMAPPSSEEEQELDKKVYTSVLKNSLGTLKTEGITTQNVNVLLDNLDEMNRLKYLMDKGTEEEKKTTEEVYNIFYSELENFVNANADKKLTSRLVSKSIRESLQAQAAKENIDALPETTKQAFAELDSLYTDNQETRDIETSLKSVSNRILKNSLEKLGDSEIIAEPLKKLEKELTGKESEALEDTYLNVKDFFRKNTVNSIAKALPSAASFTSTEATSDAISADAKVVGSSPSSSNVTVSMDNTESEKPFVENTPSLNEPALEEYDEATRALQAERVIETLLGSNRTFTDEFKENLRKFGETNNVSKERFDFIRKTYESVEDEAVQGTRGYLSRINRIKGLLATSNPDKKSLDYEVKELNRMYGALDDSAQKLEVGIAEAQKKAEELNKTKTAASKKTQQYKSEYLKENGKQFIINIVNSNGKWTAHIEEANKRLKTKKRYLSDIRKELGNIRSQKGLNLPGGVLNSSGYIVPVKEGPKKQERQADETYIKNTIGILKDVGVKTENVTKLIIGEKASLKWSPRGDYKKANITITNTKDYTSDDVVLINSIGLKEKRKGYKTPSLGKEAQSSLSQALKAGASIIIDNSMLISNDKKDPKNTALHSLIKKIKDKGYVSLEGAGRVVLVKQTPENRVNIEKRKTRLEKEKKIADQKDKDKKRLISLYRALELDTSITKGTPLTSVERTALEGEYNSLKEKVAKDSYKDDISKLEKSIRNQSQKEVEEKGNEIIENPSPDPVNVTDRALEKAINTYVKSLQNSEETGKKLLSEWNDITSSEDTSSTKREKLLNILRPLGIKAQQVIKNLLSYENSIGTGKDPIYEVRFLHVKTQKVYVDKKRAKPSDEQVAKWEEANKTPKGVIINAQKHEFLDVRRVEQDASKLVKISKTTPLNSLGLEFMPALVKNKVKSFTKSAGQALAKVTETEKNDQTDAKDNKNNYLKGSLYLYDSPARGLLLNKEGKFNEEAIAAIYLAIGEVAFTDQVKLSRGYKKDGDIANMFGVQEFEVTKEMREVAYRNGALAKTVAESVGKKVLQQLGLSKKIDDNTSKEEFEALKADLGNSALLIAEKEGIITFTQEKSNTLADMYKDGVVEEDEKLTYFINLNDKEVKNEKYKQYEVLEEVKTFITGYEELADAFPEAVTERKEPLFNAPNEEAIEKATSSVRNDIVNKEIPDPAKKTIKKLMSVPYEVNVKRIKDFLEQVEDYNVLRQLGYIDIENDPDFESMYFSDKEVQESKNRDILKSIDELKRIVAVAENKGLSKMDIYFNWSYVSNDRYMLDSNTINPQTDKIHRFLILPKEHNTDYKIERSSNGGLLFKAQGVKAEQEDQSYMLRLAIAQGLGKGVDKMDPVDVIKFSDAMLNMDENTIHKARESLLNSGSFEISVKGTSYTLSSNNNSTSDADPKEEMFELEAEHITHALQTLDALLEIKHAIKTGSNAFTTDLSLEFDSLTSGFANKIQQMPILGDLPQHLARVGVITKEVQEALLEAAGFKGEGIAFDPSKGHSVADILAAGKSIGFFDSYQNLSKKTIEVLQTGEKQNENLSAGLKEKSRSGRRIFEAIKPLLPGGEAIDLQKGTEFDISSAIRKLFKNPFMIFNYSAGINRIITNLSNSIAHDIARTIATADLVNPKNEAVVQVAQDLIDGLDLINPSTSKVIKTPKELQKVLTEHRLSDVKLEKDLVVSSPNVKRKHTAKNLEQALEHTAKLTYGESVKEIFEQEFSEFIKIQDSMNDLYKVAFRIFDHKRVKTLNKRLKESKNNILTVQDHKEVLEELWEDFPWIVGPLTDKLNKNPKDIIPVISVTTKTSNTIEEARKKPQTVLSAGSKYSTRTISPLVKYLEEAVNAGSVLPFHSLDGAEMSYAVNNGGSNSIVAIHDAVIAKLSEIEQVAFTYQKGMHTFNKEYSLMEELAGLAERLKKTIDSDKFEKEFKDVSSKKLKLTQSKENEGMTFSQAANQIISDIEYYAERVKEAREDAYGESGSMKGAWHGNLVSTGAGMYQEGQDSPDYSYRKEFEELYGEYKDGESKSETPNSNPEAALVEAIEENERLKKAMLSSSKVKNVEALTEKLLTDEKFLQSFVQEYKNRKEAIKNNKKIVKAIENVLDVIQLEDNSAAVEPVEVLNDARDSLSALAEITNETKGCKNGL